MSTAAAFCLPAPKETLSHFALSIILLSGIYDEVINSDGTTEGEAILIRFGFTIDGQP